MPKKTKITDTELLGDMALWNDKYFKVVMHAVKLHDGPKEAKKTIGEFLSAKAAKRFRSTNPSSRAIWIKALLRTFLEGHLPRGGRRKTPWDEALEQRLVVCGWMTFTDLQWSTAHNNIRFDLEKAKQKVRNALRGLDFLASFEAAVFNNQSMTTGGVKGKVVSFHCHAIVWAASFSQIRRRRTLIVKRFTPLFGNRSGIRIDHLKKQADLQRTLRYQGKMPVLGYRIVPKRNGGRQNKPTELSYKTHFYLFEAFKNCGLFDLWLAGGEGAQILAEARDKLDLHYHNQWRRKQTKGQLLYPIISAKNPVTRKF